MCTTIDHQGKEPLIIRDDYAESAEYLDIMSRPMWDLLSPELAELLRESPPPNEPILDIGAGSGLGTMVVARALPDTEIIAVEPSPALRAVLLAKVVGDADLVRRITVIDADIQRAVLPDRIGIALAINMIGHLDAVARAALWRVLAQRLVPGGRIVLTLQPPDSVVGVPETRFCEMALGRRTYEGWGQAEPSGADSVTWRMRYRTLEAGTIVRERAVEYLWWVIAEGGLRNELNEHGFSLRAIGHPQLGLYTAMRDG